MKKMNSKRVLRTVWALTLCLCLGVVGYFAFTALATDPPKGAAPESMSPKTCYAQWTVGPTASGWNNLGEVSGFLVNKKKACKALTVQACSSSTAVNFLKGAQAASTVCPGGVYVYFDTQVEGKINSRDGYCLVKPDCECKIWTGTTCTRWAYK